MKSRILEELLFGAWIVFLCAGAGSSRDTPKANVRDVNAPSALAELVLPIERNGAYVLELTDGTDTVLFECTAEEGGLITKFMLNDKHLISQLTGSSQYGSTFWPSPQTWGWPPSSSMPNLATNSYQAAIEADSHTIVLESAVQHSMGLQFIKRFSPDLVNMAVHLRYTIRNTSDGEVSVAPWEVTRVIPGGVTFFPTGYEVFKNNLATREAIGMTWFLQPTQGASGDSKLFADGSDGWIAHATSDMVFIKTFADLPASVRAPNEGEIEIYANASIYQEIENQGAYATISAGGEVHWDLKWFLRPLPVDAEPAIGNQPLVDFAASFASRTPDFNADERVDFQDFALLAQQWHQTNAAVNLGPVGWADHLVECWDISLFTAHWLKQILPLDLIGYWPLDESEGDQVPDLTDQHHGTLLDGTAWAMDLGHRNDALAFDGVSGAVILPAGFDPAKGPFSLFVWIKGGAPGQVIVSQENAVDWLLADPWNGFLKTNLQGTGRGDAPMTSQVVVTDDLWHRVGLVWNLTHLILIVDDVEVARSKQGIFPSISNHLYLGTNHSQEAGTFWYGLMDEVRLHNRAVQP
ncbi:MAG: DUF4380 domain-containing protein [Phycisphaerae bacterium]|nr:DUF4380 domain-containing protein [Phycisphaerae bacterium]